MLLSSDSIDNLLLNLLKVIEDSYVHVLEFKFGAASGQKSQKNWKKKFGRRRDYSGMIKFCNLG